MGAILGREYNENFSGLQIFCGVSAILGGTILAVSTRMLAKTKSTWIV